MNLPAVNAASPKPSNSAPLVLGDATISWKSAPPDSHPVPLQGPLSATRLQTVRGSLEDALLAARKLSEQTSTPWSGTFGAVGVSQAAEGSFELRALSIGTHFPVPLPLAGPGMKGIDTIKVTRATPDLLALVGGDTVAKFENVNDVTLRF